MFKKNDAKHEQQSLFGRENEWTAYQTKMINNSWVKLFHDVIFPKIDEDKFSVLYSDNKASRPNIPVNIIIALLIIKEITNSTDEEILGAFYFDSRIQYATHTLNDTTHNMSKNIIGNFRHKIQDYYDKNKINLLEEELKRINDDLIKLSNIDQSIKRMDSLMISSSCQRLNRIELIYDVNYNFIKMLNNKKIEIDKYKAYLEEKNRTDTLYRLKSSETETKLEMLLNQSIELYNIYKDDEEIIKTYEFKILKRLIDEQYDDENKKPKSGKEIKPTSMQTPVDPDATYRYKYQGNIGYVGNITEAVDTNGETNFALITNWEIEQNIVSDKELIANYANEKKNSGNKDDELVIVDGGFYTVEGEKELKEAGITIHPTELVGKKGKESNLGDFEIDMNNLQILKCANNVEPTTCEIDEEGTIKASFSAEKCNACPLKDQCPCRHYKSRSLLTTNEHTIRKFQIMKARGTEEYQKVSNLRAGIEGIPSILRRRYNIDNRPVKGLFYLKSVFGAKVIAINLKRMVERSSNNNIIESFECSFHKINFEIKISIKNLIEMINKLCYYKNMEMVKL